MKKILLVTRPICPPWDEASKNFAFTLARHVNTFEMSLLTCGLLPDLPVHIKQKAIYTSGNFTYLQKIRLIKHLRKLVKEYDIIHYLFTPTKQNAFLVKRFVSSKIPLSAKTIQTIATLREDLFSDKEIKDALFSNLIITYSDYSARKLNGLGFTNVKRVYPGIDLEYYRPKDKNQEYLKRYGFSKEDFIINFSGEYSRLRAIDDVINAFIALAKKHENIKLSLAVRIKNKDDASKKQRVISKLRAEGVFGKVAFHDDASYDLAEIFNLCDVSVFPVREMKGKFDIPLAVVEAMACAKTVILSDLEILKELAVGSNSVTIKRGDVNALIDGIGQLYNNENLKLELETQARRFVEENFDVRKIAQIYSEIYRILTK